jgi:WD40 repeat protein
MKRKLTIVLTKTVGMIFVCCTLIYPLSAANLPKKQARVVVELPTQNVDKRPVLSKVSLSADGKLMATAGDDHYVRIWNAKTGELAKEFEAHDDWVRGAVFNPVGNQLVTIGQNGQIKIWNWQNLGTPILVRDKVRGAKNIEFSPDGTKFAVSGFDPAVYCFETASQKLLFHLAAPSDNMTALKFSPDSTLLAAGGRTGVVRIWRTDNGKVVTEMKGDSRRVNALAFSPDGKQIALGTNGSRISIWNPQNGTMIAVLPERYGKTFSLQYCGINVLASGESDNIIRLWDVENQREMTNLIGHTGTVSTLYYDEQLNNLISGSFDTTIRYWAMMQ